MKLKCSLQIVILKFFIYMGIFALLDGEVFRSLNILDWRKKSQIYFFIEKKCQLNHFRFRPILRIDDHSNMVFCLLSLKYRVSPSPWSTNELSGLIDSLELLVFSGVGVGVRYFQNSRREWFIKSTAVW